mmetsp:Transcript_27248/g.26292  ORF Transcript_27248/g.26292 Transcript_27248/m.26292 type:complete len:138 (+) Transcript_27248:2014-2427(+)
MPRYLRCLFSSELGCLADFRKELLGGEKVASLLSFCYALIELLVLFSHVGILQSHSQKYLFEALLLEVLQAEVFAKLLPIVELHSQLLNHLYFPQRFFQGSSVPRNLEGYDTSSVVFFLEDVDVVIAHPSQERGAAQ